MLGSIGNPSHTSNKKQEGGRFAVSFKPENFIPGLVIGFILGLFLDLSKPVLKSGIGCKKSILLSGKHQQKQLTEANNSNDEELKMVLVGAASGVFLAFHGGHLDLFNISNLYPWWHHLPYLLVALYTLSAYGLGKGRAYMLLTQRYHVLIVRQDLRMGAGKIASQCAHAATGMYSELMQCRRSLLRQWEICGQPKIVLKCKNQNEMNRLKETADSIGLPTFVVADAGRTQISAGSKTVLAIGPGSKASIDSVTGRLSLL